MSLRRRLSVLVAVALTPPVMLTLYNTVRWQLVLEKEARDEVLSAARQVSAELAQVAEGTRQLMTAMSKHPAVPGDEEACKAYFKSVIAGIPIYREAAVVDSNAKFHCSTIPIPPSLDVRDRIYFRGPIETGKLTIGTLVQGRVTRSSSIHVSMPFTNSQGVTDGIIVLIVNPERLATEFASRPWQTRHRIVVLDREGSLVFSVPQEEDAQARETAKDIFQRTSNGEPGVIDATGTGGRQEIVGYVPLTAQPDGLYVAVSIDRERAFADAWTINAQSLALALAAILLAMGGAWVATHLLITQPVHGMIRTARRREAGDINAPFPRLDPETELGQLTRALSSMSRKISELLEQKEFLLRELQHRVMNSLTLLASVLDMQRRYITNDVARAHLARARDRVVAMGTVYRYLYQTDTSDRIEFSSFLRIICAESENAYAGRHKPSIAVEAEKLYLSGSHAIALAMLTHELITNALKHAYEEGEPGPIEVKLVRVAEAGGLELRVADRGRGLPEDFDVAQSASLGMKVITSTAAQLGGTVEVNRLERGTEFVIRLPETVLDKDQG